QNPVSSKIIIREGASSRDPQVLIIAPYSTTLAAPHTMTKSASFNSSSLTMPPNRCIPTRGE
ncbi:hypothetical protein, partial [Mycobacteroides abscessus]